MSDKKELQVKGKQEVQTQAEQTTPGAVFTPAVDIFETNKDITLMADLPGVKPQGLNIDLRDSVLTIVGDIARDSSDQGEAVLTEYEIGRFYRQFTVSEIVNQDKIEANLTDGVLRLVLPKVEKATPRRIEIKAA